jgi:tetratricopeptide (TPR) repeat protein
MKAGLEIGVNQEAWDGAARNANNLSELMLTLGDVRKAVDCARQSVTHADRACVWNLKRYSWANLANSLHQNGNLIKAEKWFKEAETIQRENESNYPLLYSIEGFQFCDFLLARGAYQEVMERAQKFLEWQNPSDSLLTISLEILTLGRAWMMRIQEEGSGDFGRAMESLDRAVKGLREAGDQEFIMRGLLARAACFRIQGQFSQAWDDLKEAKEIAEAGDMKLHLVDYHLEAGRVSADEGKDGEAKSHFKTAAEMIEKTGYHRRDKEVMNVE